MPQFSGCPGSVRLYLAIAPPAHLSSVMRSRNRIIVFPRILATVAQRNAALRNAALRGDIIDVVEFANGLATECCNTGIGRMRTGQDGKTRVHFYGASRWPAKRGRDGACPADHRCCRSGHSRWGS